MILISLFILLFIGYYFSDTQSLFNTYSLSTPALIFIAYTPMADNLSKELPNPSIIQFSVFFFVFGLNILIAIGIILLYFIIRNDSNYDISQEGFINGEFRFKGQFNTVIFLANSVWNIGLVLLTFVSKPFKKPFYYNKIISVFILFNMVWTLLMLFFDSTKPSGLEIVSLPSSIKLKLFGISFSILFLMFLVDIIQKKISMKKKNRNDFIKINSFNNDVYSKIEN